MTDELEPGGSTDLDTCCNGGPVITRDSSCTDEFRIEGNGGVLSRGEIKTLAELAGFDVTDPETRAARYYPGP